MGCRTLQCLPGQDLESVIRALRRLLLHLENAGSHPVESCAEDRLQKAQFRRVVVRGIKPAVIAVVSVVAILVAQHLSDARATHPEDHELEGRRWRVSRLQQLLVKPPCVDGNGLVHFPAVLLCHGLKGRVAAAFHDIESQTASHEVEVLHDLAPAVDSLDHDAREGLPVKARTVEHEAEPVEKGFHDGGDLERVVWRGEDDSVGGHHLVDQDVPVVLKRAALFPTQETGFAAATQAEVVDA